MAALLGGAAVGVITAIWRSREGGKTSARGLPTARATVIRLERTATPARVSAEAVIQYAALKTQISRLEDRVDRHDTQLRAIPATEPIGVAIDRVFERSAKALDERFAEQTRSIESLKTMVSQTDELLEKVLDSIYSLPEMPREPEADAKG